MAIDLSKLEWATDNIIQTVTYTDENGTETEITVANKQEPTAQFKDSGALFEEPIPRAYLNYMLHEIYLAIQDLDTRVTTLEP